MDALIKTIESQILELEISTMKLAKHDCEKMRIVNLMGTIARDEKTLGELMD